MESTRAEPSSTAATPHATGDALMAVAEGDPQHQPSEATLNHIFTCEHCSGSVREIRAGLATLATPAPRSTSATVPLKVPTQAAAPGSGLVDPDPLLASLRQSEDDYDRSRRLIVKVVVVGILLVFGMLWMRSFAAGLH